MKCTPIIFEDMDGTAIEPIDYPDRKPVDMDVLAGLRADYERLHDLEGVEVMALSDKPAGQFPTLVHILMGRAAARFHFGEAGATRYDTVRYHVDVHPDFGDFANTTRKSIRRALEDAGLWRPEPGGKLVCITVVSDEDWNAGAKTGRIFLEKIGAVVDMVPGFRQPLDVVRLRYGEDGHIVTIHPSGLTKARGVDWIVQTYGLNGVDWHRSFFVGDGTSDLDAAREFCKLGVRLACVGNAVTVLKDFVREHDGFVATGTVERGLRECVQWYEQHVLPVSDQQAARLEAVK